MISDTLKAFIAVAEQLSFSKAAHVLFITQPAVSMKIKILEEELNQQLFIRDRKALILTPAGEVLYEKAQLLQQEVRNTYHQLEALQNIEKGHLTIGISDTVSRYFLPARLKLFIEQYPHIQLSFLNIATPEIIELTQKHTIDIGFVLAPFSIKNLMYTPLFKYNDVMISSEKQPIKSMRDIEKYPLLLLNKDTHSRQLIDGELAQAEVTPLSIIEVSNTSVQKEFVKIGLGVGIVPDYALLPSDPFMVKKIPAFTKREIGVCITPLNSKSMLVNKFLECIATPVVEE